MLGRALKPQLGLYLVCRDSAAARIKMSKLVLRHGIRAVRAFDHVRQVDRFGRSEARLSRRTAHIPGDDPCNDRECGDGERIMGASADDPKPLAAIATSIRRLQARTRA